MRKAFIAGAVMLGVAMPSLAAETGKWTVGLHPGYAAIIGSELTKDFMKNSFALQASAEYQFHKMLSAGLEAGYILGHKMEGKNRGYGFTSDIKLPVCQITPFIRASKALEGGITPYAVFGMGYYHNPRKEGTMTYAYDAQPGPLAVEKADWFGFNLGGGVQMPVMEKFLVGLDFRFHNLTKRHDAPIQYFLPSLRLSCRF
ncbi:MAG: porin family protein [Elusimicrobia bacterium]|nr:porin family protein [Elusimicrobiota bacterium]